MDENGIVGYIIFNDGSESEPFLTQSKGIEIAQIMLGIKLSEKQFEKICTNMIHSSLPEEDGYLDLISEIFSLQIFELQQKMLNLRRRIRDDEDDGEEWKKG